MFYLPLVIVLLMLPSAPTKAAESLELRSSVSVGFENGLHSKYLQYVADKLAMPLKVTPLSLSRRLRALKKGELDLVVGLQKVEQQQEGLIYIEPPYQTLASTFFVRAKETGRLTQFEDLTGLKIAITPKVSYFSEFDKDTSLTKVEVDSLQQKIKLLVNKRVDAFIHNKDSTEVSLKIMELTEQVSSAQFQPIEKRNYYFAVSRVSRLYSRIEQLKKVIQQGVDSGEFAEIRRQHYLALAKNQLLLTDDVEAEMSLFQLKTAR